MNETNAMRRIHIFHSNTYIIVSSIGGWNTVTPTTITLGSATNPVTKLLNVHGKLWCAIQGVIKILNVTTLRVENQLQISPDVKPITNMAVYNNHVWISVQNSAQIKCYHSNK